MDPRVEEILMARAMQDGASQPTALEALSLGAGGGATLGAMLAGGGKTIGDKFTRRMAGGLVGAILGGGLGVGTRQMMIDNSPAAKILAKGQTEGLTSSDVELLKDILADTYTQMGIR